MPTSEPDPGPVADQAGLVADQAGLVADQAGLVADQSVLDYAHRCLEAMQQRADTVLSVSDRVVQEENSADARVAQAYLRRRQDDLRRGSGPLVFGRIDHEPDLGGERFYIGRRHVEDEAARPVVVDWRAPVAAPFYRATVVDPCGLTRRGRFSVTGTTLEAVFDEDLTDPDGDVHGGVPDPLLAELERSRTGQMRDIVATIAAEQDEIIRADLGDLLVVQGGPGTGKTAVGLHRAAFLLFGHRDYLGDRKTLVVGPNPVFLRYIAEVLPSLGETAVTQSTAPGLLAARYRIRAVDTEDSAVVKGDLRMATVIERFLNGKIVMPDAGLAVRAGAAIVRFTGGELTALAATARGRNLPLNTARDVFRQLIVQEAWRRHRDRPGVDPGGQPQFVAAANRDAEFKKAIDRCWPSLSPPMIVRELYRSPAKLARAADGVLTASEQAGLRRRGPAKVADEPWTEADVILIDEVGARVQGVPVRYGHVVVDEAQDHSAMSLRLLARRAEGLSMTVLGDLAQATTPVAVGSWEQAVAVLVGAGSGPGGREVTVRRAELTVGYRLPGPILDWANRLLAEAAPGITPTQSIRVGGAEPVVRAVDRDALASHLIDEVAALVRHTDSVAVVATPQRLEGIVSGLAQRLGSAAAAVTVLDADAIKGLEFDAVIVVEPSEIVDSAGNAATGLRRLYVAMTRAVRHLGVVHAAPLPAALVTTPS